MTQVLCLPPGPPCHLSVLLPLHPRSLDTGSVALVPLQSVCMGLESRPSQCSQSEARGQGPGVPLPLEWAAQQPPGLKDEASTTNGPFSVTFSRSQGQPAPGLQGPTLSKPGVLGSRGGPPSSPCVGRSLCGAAPSAGEHTQHCPCPAHLPTCHCLSGPFSPTLHWGLREASPHLAFRFAGNAKQRVSVPRPTPWLIQAPMCGQGVAE